tara:strand:+ start:8790 stop:13148 length:4359 start_codon:yes stop_codon:yes gene_type:complete
MKPEDKKTINALEERFKAIQLELFKISKQTKVSALSSESDIKAIKADIINSIRQLAALPPPTKKDDVGFSGATDAIMRNFLGLIDSGADPSISDFYRAVQVLKRHSKTQIGLERWKRWNKSLEPLAKEEAKQSGDDLTKKYIFGSGKMEGTTKDGGLKYRFDGRSLVLNSGGATLNKKIYETLAKAGVQVMVAGIKGVPDLMIPFRYIRTAFKILDKGKFAGTVKKGIQELKTKIVSWKKVAQTAGAQTEPSEPNEEYAKAVVFLEKFTKALFGTFSKNTIMSFKITADVLDECTISDVDNYSLCAAEEIFRLSKPMFDRRKYLIPPFPKSKISEAIKYLRSNHRDFYTYSSGKSKLDLSLIDATVGSVKNAPDKAWKEDLLFVLLVIQKLNKKVWKIKQQGLTIKPFIFEGDYIYFVPSNNSLNWKLKEFGEETEVIRRNRWIANRNINNEWYKGFYIPKLDALAEEFKNSENLTHLEKPTLLLKEFVKKNRPKFDALKTIEPEKTKPKTEPKKTEPKKTTKHQLSISKRKTALNLLDEYAINYSKDTYEKIKDGDIDDTQLDLILKINDALSQVPKDKNIVGVSFLPKDFQKKEEEENYFTLTSTRFDSKIEGVQLVIHTIDDIVGKWFVFKKKIKREMKYIYQARVALLAAKDTPLYKIEDDYAQSRNWFGLTNANVQTRIAYSNYVQVFTLNKYLGKIARYYDKKGQYAFAYGIRSVLLRRAPIFDDCSELAELWGKGEFKDVDPTLLKKIKKMIPKKFEADGIIPSKQVGVPAKKVKFKPYEYQQIGSAFAWMAGGRAYIGDTMGLGKTIQGLLFLSIGEEQGKKVYPALIVCPAGLQDNWIKEINAWLPTKTVSKIDSKEKTDITVTSFNKVNNYSSFIEDRKFKTFIVDEAHYIKNEKSMRSKSFRLLATRKDDKDEFITPYILLLSGTPLENRVDELFAQFNALRPDLFPSKEAFNMAFSPKVTRITKDGFKYQVEDREAVEAQDLRTKLSKAIRCIMIRRLKSDVQNTLKLPNKRRILVNAEVGEEARKLYKKMQDETRNLIAKSLQKRFTLDIAKMIKGGILPKEAIDSTKDFIENELNIIGQIEKTVLAVYGYLRRAAGEAKIPVATQWVKDFVTKTKKPLLIWVDHQKVLNSMVDALKEINVSYGVIDGSVSSKKRSELVDQFQNGELQAMVMTKAGREGLTLTQASDALFVERWLVPTWEEQAEDRIYRIGQDKDVDIHYLQFKGSFDDKIEEMINSKRAIIDAVVGEEEVQKGSSDTKIEDSLIKKISADMTKRIVSELSDAPLTNKELMPTKKMIKDALVELGAQRELLQFKEQVDAPIQKVFKGTRPSDRAKVRVQIWNDIPNNGISLVEFKDSRGSSMYNKMKKDRNIRIVEQRERVPITDVGFSPKVRFAIREAMNLPDKRLPMYDAKKLMTKQQIKQMLDLGYAQIVKQDIEI